MKKSLQERPDLFARQVQRLVSAPKLFPKKRLHVDLVMNPHAGAFRNPRTWRQIEAELSRLLALWPEPTPEQTSRIVFSVHKTAFAGDEKNVLNHLLEEDPADYSTETRLVLVAGGDGTALGVFTGFLDLPEDTRRGSLLFRLPLGTGNDAADAPDLESAFHLLRGEGRPQAVQAVKVTAPNHPARLAFNIAGAGMDAYVANLTNRLKKWLPGDSYRLMVDVATLFYETSVNLGPYKLVITAPDGQVETLEGRYLLTPFGASGYRRYGSGMKILPGPENLCLGSAVNLLTKLSYRQPIYEGTHAKLKGIRLVQAQKLEIHYNRRLPVQCDGECFWLEPGDFPLVMEILPTDLSVLAKA